MTAADPSQPTGTVTLVFTDVEGSTKLLAEIGAGRYRDALEAHRACVRAAFARYGGYEVDTAGDSFFYSFSRAADALGAVREAISQLEAGPLRIRVGIHTGEPILDPPNYIGMDVHRTARIMGVTHGGQAVISEATRALVPEADLLDLGLHRLKDLSAPIRLYQLGHGTFPPLASLHRTNLPVPATPFVGRMAELRAVAELLERDGTGFVSLTGPGGTGKTRLVLQAAAEVAERYPDGVWWVPLAPLADPGVAPSAVMRALDLVEDASRDPVDVLADRLVGRCMLLVLDNAEHLLPGIAGLVARLRDITGPQIAVTSRARLGLQGERVFPVPPMDEPDAAALFVGRARLIDPGFEPTSTVHELCRRLDNLPLALELAAARTSLFDPDQLLDRLAARLDLLRSGPDVDPRQQTLRATIDWSYRLLDRDVQQSYARLSVFRGGWTVEAAEAVCGAPADALQSLVDQSVVRPTDGQAGRRLFMLDTIGQHSAELLAADPVEASRRRRAHAMWYVDFAERADQAMTSAPDVDDTIWWRAMEDERENVRAALEHLRDAGAVRDLARLCIAGVTFWFFRGPVREGRSWIELVLGLGPPDDLLPHVEVSAAVFLFAAGTDHHAAALDFVASAIAHARELGDLRAELFALAIRGNLEFQPDPAAARQSYQAVIDLARRVGDRFWATSMSGNLANLALESQDWQEARRQLDRIPASDQQASIVRFDHLAARVALELHDLAEARRRLGRALRSARRNPMFGGYNELTVASRVAAEDGDPAGAACLIAAAVSNAHARGILETPSDIRTRLELEAALRTRLTPGDWASATARGRELELDDALQVALATIAEPE